MKLNPDCIRAVMLEIEKSHKYYLDDQGNVTTDPLTLEAIDAAVPKFSTGDIYYALFNLEQAGYIDLTTRWSGGSVYTCHVNYMTFSGHEFLDSIRDSKQWAAIKKGISTVGNFSLATISSVAEGITSALITTYVGQMKL